MRFEISKRIALKHIAFWLAYTTTETTLVYSLGVHAPWYQFAAFYIVYIALFYSNTQILLLRGKRSWIAILSLVVVQIIFFTCILSCVENIFRLPAQRISVIEMIRQKKFIALLSRELFFLALSVSNYNTIIATRKTKEAALAQIRQLEAEQSLTQLQNAYRAAQIKPHLLFNTLHFIHTDQELTDKSTKSVMLLTDIMRYALKAPDSNGKIELGGEVKQIANLVALHELQSDDESRIGLFINIPEEKMKRKIVPFLLVTLTENIFKHGVVNDAEVPAMISITVDGDVLVFYSKNRKAEQMKIEKSGVGLEHLRKILTALYPGRSSLEIKEGNQLYEIKLKLEI